MKSIDLSKILSIENIDLTDSSINGKNEIFQHMAALLKASGYIEDEKTFINSLNERELLGTTFMENGLVLPHGKSDTVKKAGVAICRFKPTSYDLGTGQEVTKAVMLAIPASADADGYIRMLASVSCALLEKNVMDSITVGTEPEKVIEAMKEYLVNQNQ